VPKRGAQVSDCLLDKNDGLQILYNEVDLSTVWNRRCHEMPGDVIAVLLNEAVSHSLSQTLIYLHMIEVYGNII
jgi:hypothetical protein